MAKPLGPFAVFYGDEEYLLDKVIEVQKRAWKTQKRLCISVEGSSTTESKFVSLCETQSFFEDDLRGIILDNAQDLKVGKVWAEYLNNKDSKDLGTRVTILYRGTTLPKAWSEAIGKGMGDKFLKFKPWEQAKKIQQIHAEAKNLGLSIAPDVPEFLFALLGDNLRQSISELKKCSYLVPPKGVVERKHVALVVVPDKPAETWQVSEAALAKNPKLAMNLISILSVNMGDSFVVPVTISLQKQVERLLVVRQMMDKNDTLATIAAVVEKPEFYCQKNILPVAQKHSVSDLIGYMKTLCKLETQVKGAARSKRTLVELAVLSIAV